MPYSSIYFYDEVITRAIHVTSNSPVAVVMAVNPHEGIDTNKVVGGFAGLTEASAQIPLKNQSIKSIAHSTISLPGSVLGGQSDGTSIVLLSLQDSNHIQYKLSVTGLSGFQLSPPVITQYKDSVYTLWLNKGEQFNFWAFSADADPGGKGFFSGSYFESVNNKKLSVNVIPGNSYCLDNLAIPGQPAPLQELPLPLAYYGTHYHGLPLAGFTKTNYSILASQSNTAVTLNGVVVANLDSLGFLDTCFAGSGVITTTKPVSIFMAGCPTFENDITYSQHTVTLSGDHQLQTRSMFATIDEPDTLNNYILGVTMPTMGVSQFTLNGATVNSNLFHPFTADSSWSWANIPLQKGKHIAESPVGFHGIHTTWYSDSLPYTGGGPLYPSYGFVLPECNAWPQDSFVHVAGISQNNWVAFSAFTTTACPGQTVYFKPNHLRHTTWYWNFGDGKNKTQHIANNRAGVISHTFTQAGSYWVTLTDSSGCTPKDSVLIVVENGVVANFTSTTTTSCSGTFVQLQNQSTGATNYSWQWPGGSSTATNPSFNYQSADTTIEVTLIASNQNCADTLSQTVNIQSSTFNPQSMPNVITPNNDGVNDEFCIPQAVGFSDCYAIQIFNRWGSEVFTSQNPQDCWQAQNAAAGVYFYVLTIGEQNFTGEVTVFK